MWSYIRLYLHVVVILPETGHVNSWLRITIQSYVYSWLLLTENMVTFMIVLNITKSTLNLNLMNTSYCSLHIYSLS